ncbi:hypothetical protein P154DRAFT_582484 [Amniculicola lignicola CBS 123094]|uniref:F-box domain-containing protein n=1 Tax=Amniculicola lignicola CBS 123094 TaxID=1392246 RepID=A0A6A5VYL2_9PLEO|nr:hypothetical protein P154DRAFT_582484 [Amniculicola lignicola CBS 123094]
MASTRCIAPRTRSQTATCSSFKALPNELRLMILGDLFALGTMTDFCNALRVCKNWNELGTPLLWTNVLIKNSNILFFIRSITLAAKNSERIRNISVYIHPIKTAYLQGRVHSKTLSFLRFPGLIHESPSGIRAWQMPDILPNPDPCLKLLSEWQILESALMKLFSLMKENMSSLISASFRIATHTEHQSATPITIESYRWNIRLPRHTLGTYLKSLPPTCVNVEFDDCGRSHSMPHQIKSEHVCPILHEVIPRLQHVQIKAFDLCPGILGCDYLGNSQNGKTFNAPQLQTLHINLRPEPVTRMFMNSKRNCELLYISEDDPYSAIFATSLGPTFHQNAFAKSLRAAYDSGAMPKIRALKLMNWYTGQIHNSDRYTYYSSVDIIQGTLRVVPKTVLQVGVLKIEPSGISWDLADEEMTKAEWPNYCEYAIALDAGKELYSRTRDAYKMLESAVDDGWFTTQHGIRLPQPECDAEPEGTEWYAGTTSRSTLIDDVNAECPGSWVDSAMGNIQDGLDELHRIQPTSVDGIQA